MKIAKDFRKKARESLTGNWPIAVLVGLVAALLGGIASEGPSVRFNLNTSNADFNLSFEGHDIFSTAGGLNPEYVPILTGIFSIIFIVALVVVSIYFILGSFVGVGYAKFNLNLVDKNAPVFETLFAYFSYWKTTAVMKLLKMLYVFLWSLLFLIPGIVAGYSYAMTDYILAENPNLTASEAVEQSKAMMHGNRFRLFCLQLSFIGWDLLAALTFGIGYLWLTPYKQAAYAAFYREVSGTEVAE